MRRVLMVCWYALAKILTWLLTVFLLGALPIGLHLWTILINHDSGSTLSHAAVSDAYLYTFIVAMTAFTDTLVDERKRPNKLNSTISYCVMAVIAAVGYFAASINYVVAGPGNSVLTDGAIPLFCIFTAAYAIYKVPVLCGAGKAEWEQEEQEALRRGGAA